MSAFPWPPSRGAALSLAVASLLGQIGPTVVGVAVDFQPNWVVLTGFYTGKLRSDDREGLDDASAYIVAEAPPGVGVQLKFIQASGPILSATGVWVFVRAGFIGVGPADPRYAKAD